MMLRPLFTVLAGSGDRARLSVLIFHRVLETPDPLISETPTADRFGREMEWVADWFNVLPLSEAVARLRRRSLPPRALCITFDDGYADNFRVAAPILARLRLPATFFIASGFLDGGRMWNDTVIEAVRRTSRSMLDLELAGLGRWEIGSSAAKRAAIDCLLAALKRLPYEERRAGVDAVAAAADAGLPDDLMMRSDEVRGLCALGMEIGAHTVSHPILTRIADDRARQEIAGSRDDLAQLSGRPIELFAYPNGVPGVDYDARHVALARRCGFAAAFSTAHGVASNGVDLYQLPRFTPWDRSRARYGLRLAANLLRTSPLTIQARVDAVSDLPEHA